MRLFTLAILLVEISIAHGKNWWLGVFRRFNACRCRVWVYGAPEGVYTQTSRFRYKDEHDLMRTFMFR
jgi:hypothetical protein